MSLIKSTDLSFSYPGSQDQSLHHISLSIEPGTSTAILGSSGSGKTTLLQCLAGYSREIIDGEISGVLFHKGERIDRNTMSDSPIRVAYVMQEPENMFCTLKVAEEVAFGLENYQYESDAMPKIIRDSLAKVGLENFYDTEIHELSGGEQQRLAIACGLAVAADVLILDEPFTSLDPVGVKDISGLLNQLQDDGLTVIVASKQWRHAFCSFTEICLLNNGMLSNLCGPTNLLENHYDDITDCGIQLPFLIELAHSLNQQGMSVPQSCEWPDKAVLEWKKRGIRLNQNETNGVQVQKHPEKNKRKTDVTPSLTLENLSFSYDGDRVILNSVDTCLYPNNSYALVGGNGSGKTTLAKLICGLLLPQHGQVRICGKRPQRTRCLRSVYPGTGYVFQTPEKQFLTDSVFDEIALGLELEGVPEDEVKERVDSILQDMSLEPIARSHPQQINSTDKRLVALASVAVMQPDIIIVDEPTRGQDRKTLDKLNSFIEYSKANSMTLLIITHDLRFAEGFCDRMLFLTESDELLNAPPKYLMQKQELLRSSGLLPTDASMLTSAICDSKPDDGSFIDYPTAPLSFSKHIQRH